MVADPDRRLPRERAAPWESHPGTEPEPGLWGWCGGLPGRRAERLRGQGGTQLQPLRAAPRPLALVSQAPPPCPGPLDSGAPASPKRGHHVACLGPCPRPTLLERSPFSLCPVRVWVPLRVKHRPWPTAAPEPVTGQLGNTVGGPPVGGSAASEPFPAGAGVTKPQRAPASLRAVQQRRAAEPSPRWVVVRDAPEGGHSPRGPRALDTALAAFPAVPRKQPRAPRAPER